MSLILEALRKSEAERRRGEAPDLRVELPPVASPRRAAVPAWAWIAGVALVLLAALALLWPSGSGPDAERIAAGDREAAEATPATGPGTRSADDPTAGNGSGFPQVDRIAPPAPVATDEPAPSGAPAPLPPVEPVAPAASDPVPVIAPLPQAAAAPPNATMAAPQRPTALPRATLPRIAELPSAQRQRLPAMKLSMHMWNEDPARRFVVIDGQRKVEGDRVGEAAISAIDRDGVVLDLDGIQVRVPLP